MWEIHWRSKYGIWAELLQRHGIDTYSKVKLDEKIRLHSSSHPETMGWNEGERERKKNIGDTIRLRVSLVIYSYIHTLYYTYGKPTQKSSSVLGRVHYQRREEGVWLLAALLLQALLLIWENHNALHMSGRAHSVETATAWVKSIWQMIFKNQ
jgi:hypothetical protein